MESHNSASLRAAENLSRSTVASMSNETLIGVHPRSSAVSFLFARSAQVSESAIIVGIDEAGYGPLLGPLVVSAVAFEVPVSVLREAKSAADGPDLWKLLRTAVSRRPLKRGSRLAVADSKVLYDSGDHENGLQLL